MNIKYQILEDSNAIQQIAEELYQRIFGVSDSTKFRGRFQTQAGFMAVLAYNADELVGFKLGYRHNETTFYSWLGGVSNPYRGQGIGQQLMLLQHQHAQQKGYLKVQTKTMNRWKKMLILNLQNGFDIVETYPDKQGQLKIVLEKLL